MPDQVELLERRVNELESQLKRLALNNLDLLLTLEVFIHQSKLDEPMMVGEGSPERPSSRLDRIWHEVYSTFQTLPPE